MGRNDAIARLDVVPDYGRGFVFHWRLAGGFNYRGPWRFTVQQGETQEGPWVDLSPPLDDAFAWRAPDAPRVNKERELFFRLVLETAEGMYASDARMPYGDLTRSEFLIGREVMRREVLHMSRMAGVECEVWSACDYGPRCLKCIDPITGHSRDDHCRFCLGTGRCPPYRGPFGVWCLFSEDNQHKVEEGAEGNGVVAHRNFTVRMVSSVPVKKNDVLKDLRTGKMYYVGEVQVSAELRRVPLVQTLQVSEAAVTDPAYMIGGWHVA